ncbi:MAG: hypothetical protein AB7E45_00705 [Candidatus Caldatribacteriota bacterium]
MAKCILCEKWLLFSSKFDLCDNCRNFLIADLKNRARIINDSARIIKTTKNPETRISRIKLLREQVEHLLVYKKKGIDIDNIVKIGSDDFQNLNEYYNFVDSQCTELLKEKEEKGIPDKVGIKAIDNKNYPQIIRHIPERTKRLMWITDKNPEEFEVWPDMPFYKSGVNIEYRGIRVSFIVGQTNEPSLIYTRWPISRPRNDENFESPGIIPLTAS